MDGLNRDIKRADGGGEERGSELEIKSKAKEEAGEWRARAGRNV